MTDDELSKEKLSTYSEYLRKGYSWQDLKRKYEESLEITLEHVESLLEELEGNTVITADHGEAHGEYGIKDYPHSVYISSLTEVPWLKVEK